MNGELKKAELIELSNDKEPKELGTVNVQFNPNSLKLKLSNKSEGGNSRGRQRRQHTGVSSTTLSMDLVFDSSDEGTSDAPISVRTKTALVEKFVITQKGKSTPPKLRFRWGDLQVDGVVSDLSIDFDHFSAGGIPLRAKASLSLTEQDAKYEFLETGAGSKADNGAPTPTNSSGAATPGSNSPTISDQSAAALENETPAEFAARMGVSPEAWRGLDVDLSAGLSLEAGVEVGFSAGLSINAGIGVSVGVEAGVDLSLEASLGLEASAGVSSSIDQGKALTAAGGVVSAVETVKIVETAGAAAETMRAFPSAASLPEQSNPPAGPPEQLRAPISRTGLLTPSQQAAAAPAPQPVRADTRATSFGFGIPLRPQFAPAESSRHVVVGSGTQPGELGLLELTTRPTVPGWEQLPARDDFREQAGELSQTAQPKKCGCCGACSH